MDYGIEHNGKIYTPSGTCVAPQDNEARNAAIEAAEIEHIKSAPDSFVAYIGKPQGNGMGCERVIGQSWDETTWLGTKVANATRGNTWRTPRSYISSTMSMFYCRINGVEYYGRGAGEGMSIRFFKSKAKKG